MTRAPARPRAAAAATAAAEPAAAAALIDQRIRELGGWRGETLTRVRALIRAAVPGVVEEWKWQTPVWSHHGILCTGEAYKAAVKLTFAHGASVADPARLFNSSLAGATRRAIDLREGEALDARAFTALVQAAAARNQAAKAPTARRPATPRAPRATPARAKPAPARGRGRS